MVEATAPEAQKTCHIACIWKGWNKAVLGWFDNLEDFGEYIFWN